MILRELTIGDKQYFDIEPDLFDYIKKLQEENQRLYNLNNAIFRELLNKRYENKKQKEVIDKAIEYIQENTCWELRTSKVLDILKEVGE